MKFRVHALFFAKKVIWNAHKRAITISRQKTRKLRFILVAVMQELKELVYILNQLQIRPVLSGGQRGDSSSKLVKFYEGIEKNRFDTDEKAEAYLYPEGPSSVNYRKLKSDLRDKLITSVASFNAKNTDLTDYQKAYYECHRLWLVVKILTGQNANKAAMGLAVKLLKQTERFEFTLLTMDIATYLRFQYGLREGNDKKISGIAPVV